jgi:hypothetical protein
MRLRILFLLPTVAACHDFGFLDTPDAGADAGIDHLVVPDVDQPREAAPPAPIEAGAPDPVAPQVVLGERHSCALRADARLYCWGLNYFGQVGNGKTETHELRPFLVPLPDVVQDCRGPRKGAGFLS